MLKGCRRQMIVLHGTGSEIFDEAYFILKNHGRGAHNTPSDNTAMLLEANRIIEENRIGAPSRPRGYYGVRYCLFLILGMLLGAAIVILSVALS